MSRISLYKSISYLQKNVLKTLFLENSYYKPPNPLTHKMHELRYPSQNIMIDTQNTTGSYNNTIS